MAGQKEQVRFLDRDPVPPSLRGKKGRLEQMTEQGATVWVDGIRRHVPKGWLVFQGSAAVAATALDAGQGCQGSTSSPDFDESITQQAWYRLLDVCLELNLSREEADQVIAEAVGLQPDELDPSRLTWRQYLQAIERLEQLESRS